MKKFQSYFTPPTAEDEEKTQVGSDEATPAPAPTGTRSRRAGSKSSTHQLQPIRPRGRQSGPATPAPPPPSGRISPQTAQTSARASMLSVPGLTQAQFTHGRSPSDAGTIRSTTKNSPSTSRAPSLRHSFLPAGDVRNHDSDTINEIRNDMMVNWLYEQQLRKQLASGMDPYEGVVLKKARGNFTCCPPQMAAIPDSLYAVVSLMNVRCAMTVNTPVVRALLESIVSKTDLDHVPLPDGLRVQVVRTMADLPRGQLHHFAAFVVDVRMLIVWDDEPEKLLARVQTLEAKFIELIWGNGEEGEEEEDGGGPGEKGGAAVNLEELDPAQLEEALARERRPVRLESAFMVAITVAIWIVCPALGWRWLAFQTMVDGTYLRMALIAALPAQLFISLFFFQSMVTSVFQIFGPIGAVAQNSKYYSGKAPRRLECVPGALPHVTIQMPVYKEGLNAVIKLTVVSLKAAISTYEMQGGTANIFVNDDGMQLLSDDEAQARRDFYDEHNIGWVARPGHNPNPSADSDEKRFLRRGKFKKASNMNYALNVSNRVEDRLAGVNRGSRWSNEQENAAYNQALADVLQEDEGRTWAEGNIRVGDYILIIDSDTRVPQDCLLDAVSEMEQSPEVAIVQFQSGVMNVTNSFFENG